MDGADCLVLSGTLGTDATLTAPGLDCEHVDDARIASMAQRVGRRRRITLLEQRIDPLGTSDSVAQLSGWLSGPSSAIKVGYDQVACAIDSIQGGVVATNDSWLVAGALGAPFAWSQVTGEQDMGCLGKFPGVGRPRGIYTGHVASDGKTFTGNEQLASENADVTGFAFAPR